MLELFRFPNAERLELVRCCVLCPFVSTFQQLAWSGTLGLGGNMNEPFFAVQI